MATTTTLLLVLATTATLFFDLAAARCRVMMFNGGLVQDLQANPKLTGAFEKNPDKADKVIIKYMTKSGTVSASTHHFFGTSGKWYDAEAKLTAKHGAAEIPASDSNADGYYLAKDDLGTSVVADGRWTSTVDTTKEISLSLPKAKASQVAWIMGYDVATANKKPIYVYVNDGLLFRSGPLRYDAFNAMVVVQATHPATKTFGFTCSQLVSGSGNAEKTRVFVGKGNYQNALVALNAYFTEAAKQDGTAIAGYKGGATKGAHENWIYVDVVGSDGEISSSTNIPAFDVFAGAGIYVEAIAWMAVYDLKKGLVAHQVMYPVNDGFMNGELMPADGKKVEGIVVFSSPDDDKISIYDLKAGTGTGLTDVRIFYGLLAWDDAKAGLSAHGAATDGGSGNGKFFVAGSAGSDLDGKTVASVERALSTTESHKASQVMWVAARQIGGSNEGTLAHRIMQMPKA